MTKKTQEGAEEAAKSQKTEFAVYKNGEHVRTYSVEVHGEDAEELAKEFVAHAGGEIV